MPVNKTIVQINTVAVPQSGVGNVMHGINNGLKARGFNSILIAGYGKAAHADLTLQSKAGYYINALKARRYGNDGFGAHRSTRKLLRHLMLLMPDIVHLHNAHGYYLNIPMLAEALSKMAIPLVITAHDLWLCTGRCAIPGDCSNWRNLSCDECGHVERYPKSYSLRQPCYPSAVFAPLNAHIVTPSKEMAHLFSKSTLAHLPVSVIPNGIDKSVFRYSPRQPKADGLQLLAVATKWDDNKNPEALKRLAKAMPDNWHLTIVGRGIRRYIKGNASNVSFITHIDNRLELARLYQSNDVLLSPSRWETFSTVVLEAAACGRPSVVRYTPPVAGVSVYDSYEDMDQLISKIRKAAAITPDASAITTDKEMADNYIEIYIRLLTCRLP